MTMSSLLTGLAVGVLLGLCGRRMTPKSRDVPFWVLLSVATGAAMLGTVIGRFAGVDAPGVTLTEIVLQVVLAAAAVSVVTGAADRRPSGKA